jgi:two-component system NtrC family response regulator
MSKRILIIDDEPTIRMLLSRMMELEGLETLQAKDRAAAIEILRAKEVQVILCDVFLPDGNGVEMIGELRTLAPAAKVILLTAHGNIRDGVQAIKSGAFDYIVKGDDNRKIIPIVSRAMAAAEEDRKSKTPGSARSGVELTFESVIGRSPLIREAIRQARKVAETEVPVLINGETGTGKEVFAHAIHNAGPRRDRAFLALNCSAFSSELLESELFGYKAGAFTGAVKDKRGLIEEADHGTLFLDEIGEMALELQAKLLRVLETGEFVKVGDTKTTRVDVRIVSATNRNLKEEIAAHRFREDLYFRLSVFRIELPPLRERREDIPLFADFFLERYSRRIGRPIAALSAEARETLMSYSWPGNVRELMNAVEHALIVCDDGVIGVGDLPLDLLTVKSPSESDVESSLDLKSVERSHIVKVLQYTGGNKSEAARLLKIGLTTLYRKIDEYSIVL